MRSILRTAQGDVRGALADQLEARRRIGEELAVDPDYDGRLRTCRLLHATGDVSRAAEETDAALAWARTWDTPGYIGQALTVSGLIHDDVSQLREAVEHLERSPARRELAGSLVELGAALRRHGERSAAREPLRRAIDIAASGGLVAIEERAREELRVTGARLRRAEATGLAALTPSERRIVELAAGGATNAEIAQGAVRDRQDGRDAPGERLPQARDQLATAARAARPRRTLGSEYRGVPVAVMPGARRR